MLRIFKKFSKSRLWDRIMLRLMTQSFIFSKADLFQSIRHHQLNRPVSANDLCRLLCTDQRACIDPVKGHIFKPLCCLFCQFDPAGIQRNICHSLQPFRFIPVRLSMTDQINIHCHLVTLLMPSWSCSLYRFHITQSSGTVIQNHGLSQYVLRFLS